MSGNTGTNPNFAVQQAMRDCAKLAQCMSLFSNREGNANYPFSYKPYHAGHTREENRATAKFAARILHRSNKENSDPCQPNRSIYSMSFAACRQSRRFCRTRTRESEPESVTDAHQQRIAVERAEFAQHAVGEIGLDINLLHVEIDQNPDASQPYCSMREKCTGRKHARASQNGLERITPQKKGRSRQGGLHKRPVWRTPCGVLGKKIALPGQHAGRILHSSDRKNPDAHQPFCSSRRKTGATRRPQTQDMEPV